MEFDGLFGLSARSEFPFVDRILRRFEQHRAAAHRFDGFYLSVRPYHGNYPHRAPKIHLLSEVWVGGGYLSGDLTRAGRLLALGHSCGSKET